MGSSAIDITCPSSIIESFDQSFDINIDEVNSLDTRALETTNSSVSRDIPKPPPLPRKILKRQPAKYCSVSKETKDLWEKLFREGYGADVYILAEDGPLIAAHHIVLSVASPVLDSLLQHSKRKNGIRHVRVPGVPYDAFYAFIRFLYSASYEEEGMKKYVLHLLVLSHSYVVPSLKRVCEHVLECGWLTRENVIDVLQLARSCDAPRLALACQRMVVRDFKSISSTDAWKVMARANPPLEQDLLELVVEADSVSRLLPTFVPM